MKAYLALFLFIVISCSPNENNKLISKRLAPFDFKKIEFKKTINGNRDSLFAFIKKIYPQFTPDSIDDKYLQKINFTPVPLHIHPYEPMDLDYFNLNSQMDDEERIVRIAFFCHNIMPNGSEFEINTSESEISATSLDILIKKFNTNEWIGQCGEYDAFGKKVFDKYGLESIRVNPSFYNEKDSLGHIYSLVFSAQTDKFYPIDIQNNCYWILQNGDLADFKSILKGKAYSRAYIDTLNGRKDIILSDYIIPFEWNDRFLGIGRFKHISKQGNIHIVRSIIKPSEYKFSDNYMANTSKKLNIENPRWEDFIFNAGILENDGTINKNLFHGNEKLITKLFESLE